MDNKVRDLVVVLLVLVTFFAWFTYTVTEVQGDDMNTEMLIRKLVGEQTEHDYEITLYKAKINQLSAELVKVCNKKFST